MFKLKPYQENTLEALREYLEAARVDGPAKAFEDVLRNTPALSQAYRGIEGLENVPYVCLRLPTGGGKTVLAANAIGVAARSYLEQDFPVVLWLVPTNTIRQQTLEALKKPDHPYREAIDNAFEGRVVVFDIGEIEQVRPQDLTERVCVLVGTLATLRVDKTEGRKIYAHNENFEPHFARVPQSMQGLEQIEDGPDKGKIKFSFANLLHLHQPLVIMDEAHNARTSLTFEVLQRIRPACIIEFTATPDKSNKSGSNVLCSISASELKTQQMIKLPIMLTEHKTWQESIRDTVLTRIKLEELARKDAAFIRPIALIQAENKNREVTVDVVRQHLIENEKIEAGRIAIATGDQRELDGINLFDPGCKIEYIITIEALKEGWDCSFAYVFCSVANIHSSKDVEQILGRVLRMPYAEKRQVDELNRAYAHVSSTSFAQAARELHDRLVDMGFEEEEAKIFIQPLQASFLPEGYHPLFLHGTTEPLTLCMETNPDLKYLSPAEKENVEIVKHESGKVDVVVKGTITDEIEKKIVDSAPAAQRQLIKQQIQTHRYYQQQELSPAERGAKLTVPRLCINVQGELELAEKELFLDQKGWSLLDYPAEFTSAELSLDENAQTFEFDIQGKKVVYSLVDDSRQLDLTHLKIHWTDLQLVRWLDKEVRQPDVRQEVMLEFLRQCIASLRGKYKLELSALVRNKFALIKALLEKIKNYRQQAYVHGYQKTLFGESASVETSYKYAFDFSPDSYPAKEFYRGEYKFRKHFYPFIGDLDAPGEEFDCAQIIDSLPQVKYWVKNMPNQPSASFWLPTSTDRFYPDFVAELNDGRIFVVEYKGKPYVTNDDSKEKRNLGELWEERSNGKGLFLMAEKRNAQGSDVYKQLVDKISN